MTHRSRKLPFTTLLTCVSLCAVIALAVRVYRRPWETLIAALRLGMLLVGLREERVNLDGVQMRYYCGGRRGTPVILIHGLGNSAEVWAGLMPLLSREFLVYAPDMPGFGKTPLAPEGMNVATHVLYLKRFLDALGYPRVTLVGNSLGGWIATRFAIEHPERVERLYLLNSAGLRREPVRLPGGRTREAAKQVMDQIWGFPIHVPAFILDAVVRNSQTPAYAGFLQHYDPTEELDGRLDQVRVPTTILWGEQDRLLPLACAGDLHRGISGSELIYLPRIGHMPQAQAPVQVARIMLHSKMEM
jgi:abhydrolase domain-containing protein 6